MDPMKLLEAQELNKHPPPKKDILYLHTPFLSSKTVYGREDRNDKKRKQIERDDDNYDDATHKTDYIKADTPGFSAGKANICERCIEGFQHGDGIISATPENGRTSHSVNTCECDHKCNRKNALRKNEKRKKHKSDPQKDELNDYKEKIDERKYRQMEKRLEKYSKEFLENEYI